MRYFLPTVLVRIVFFPRRKEDKCFLAIHCSDHLYLIGLVLKNVLLKIRFLVILFLSIRILVILHYVILIFQIQHLLLPKRCVLQEDAFRTLILLM